MDWWCIDDDPSPKLVMWLPEHFVCFITRGWWNPQWHWGETITHSSHLTCPSHFYGPNGHGSIDVNCLGYTQKLDRYLKDQTKPVCLGLAFWPHLVDAGWSWRSLAAFPLAFGNPICDTKIPINGSLNGKSIYKQKFLIPRMEVFEYLRVRCNCIDLTSHFKPQLGGLANVPCRRGYGFRVPKSSKPSSFPVYILVCRKMEQ